MSAGAWIALGLLGGAGAVLRHVADFVVAARTNPAMPWGIFVVNVSGAFALGVLAGAHVSATTAFVLGTGLLGAYTTFSTWMLQARVLLRAGRRGAALAHLAGSLAAGLLAVAAGRALGG